MTTDHSGHDDPVYRAAVEYLSSNCEISHRGSTRWLVDDQELRAMLGAVRTALVREIEAAGSVLCDGCDPSELLPARDGQPMTHNCECPAVLVAAQLLGGQRFTAHADQCSPGLHADLDRIHDEYTEVRHDGD